MSASLIAPSSAPAPRTPRGQRRSARSVRGLARGAPAHPAPARASGPCDPDRRPPARASPRASCGGGRTPPPTSARSSGEALAPRRPARRRSPTSTESTFGHRIKHGPRHRPQRPPPRTPAAQAPTACRTRRCRRRGQPLTDLALDHRDPDRYARQLLDRAQQDAGGDRRRAGSPPPSPAAASARAGRAHRVRPVHAHVRVRVGGVAQRVAQALVDLDHVDV